MTDDDILREAEAEVEAEERRLRIDAAKVSIRERRGRPWWVRLFPFHIHIERID